MTRTLAIGLCLLAVSQMGCPGQEPDMPDAMVDGGTQGLAVRWRAVPSIPTSNIPSVRELKLRVRSIKVIGDAAPGDAATTKNNLDLEWKSSEDPKALEFPQAPAGKYAKIDIVIRGDVGKEGVQITGMAMRNAVLHPYEIEDDAQLSVSVPLPADTTLRPGGLLTLKLRMDLDAVVRGLDFNAAREDDDKLIIDEETPELLAAVRTALTDSIRIDAD